MKKVVFFLFILALSLSLSFQGVEASSYPTETVTYIAPFGAGGGTDRWARTISTAAYEHFGQHFHVVNMPGASGTVGWNNLLNRPADGYTIIQGTDTPVISLLMEEVPPFTPDEIKIACIVSMFRGIILARPGDPWSTVDGLLEYMEENPGHLTIGGTLGLCLAPAFLFDQMGLEANLITYASTGEAVTDFLGGHIDAVAVTASTGYPLVGDGTAVAVINTSDLELDMEGFENAPSATDLGYEGLTFLRWIGFHPDTPDEYVEYTSQAFENILADPSVVSLMAAMGEEVMFRPREEADASYRSALRALTRALEIVQ